MSVCKLLTNSLPFRHLRKFPNHQVSFFYSDKFLSSCTLCTITYYIHKFHKGMSKYCQYNIDRCFVPHVCFIYHILCLLNVLNHNLTMKQKVTLTRMKEDLRHSVWKRCLHGSSVTVSSNSYTSKHTQHFVSSSTRKKTTRPWRIRL